MASLMPTTERDAQALAYLARRLREETYGAGRWDDNGTFAVISRLVGQNLATTIERVCRHAADPAARTPGAIERPFVPDAPAHQPRQRDTAPVHTRCQVCGRKKGECSQDHEFRGYEERSVDISPVVEEIKGHIAPTTHAAATRALLHTEESEASHG